MTIIYENDKDNDSIEQWKNYMKQRRKNFNVGSKTREIFSIGILVNLSSAHLVC